MVRAYEAVTHEIDNVEKAVAEILGQLAPMEKAAEGKNAVGILSCYAEYVESGVVRALSERLPFDIVGATTIAGSSCGEVGDTMLSLLVLTGDGVSFSTALSGPLDREDEAALRACYESALARLPEKPVFMMSFYPLLTNVSSEYYIERMSAVSGNLPNFGAVAVDHNADYHDSMTLLNGEAARDCVAILLVSGDIAPTFYTGNISRERIFPEKGLVTGSSGNHLLSVNNMSVTDYLLSVGLKKNEEGAIAGLNSFPLIVDYGDGTPPTARSVIGMTPEGAAICTGAMPEGTVIMIGSFDPEEIVATTGRTVSAALAEKKHSALLIYACVGRFFAQGFDQSAEMNRIVECVKPAGVPYMAAYVGGELCPAYIGGGASINRVHGYSLIICAL